MHTTWDFSETYHTFCVKFGSPQNDEVPNLALTEASDGLAILVQVCGSGEVFFSPCGAGGGGFLLAR